MAEISLDRRRIKAMRDELSTGRTILFTGAGFSSDALDRDGRSIPSGKQLRDEIWHLCFPGKDIDDSTLADLFFHARLCHKSALVRLLQRRLSVDPGTLPKFYSAWFSIPWRRIYTLNVDDLERAVAKRFSLPRAIVSVSGLTRRAPRRSPPRTLQVIHLNGTLARAPDGVTFSTIQYARRIAAHGDHWYTAVARDIHRYPLLFVGTRLVESPLWQHFELHGCRKRGDPRSILVTQHLSRARVSLLDEWAIDWIRLSSRQFAQRVLAPMY